MDRLKREDGSIVRTQEELETTLNSYFSKLLQDPDKDREEAHREVLNHIPKLITDEHNQILGKATEITEVETAVKQMETYKAPGPNGFTTNLFHACWDWLEEEI